MNPHHRGVKKHRSKIDNQSWEVSTPTNSCASFSSGDPPSGATGCKCVSETAEDGRVRDCDGYSEGKRGRVDRVADGATPSVCNSDAENTFPMKNVPEICDGTPSLELRVPPIILRRVPAGNGYGFRSENSGLSLNEGEEDNETNNDSEAELNLLESFSCQRTQTYAFFYQSSCARVCKTWPFPRSGPPDELRSLLSGHRWIVTSSFPVTPTTTCILENDVQDKLCKEALEVQAASSVSAEKLESNRSVQRAFEDSSHVPEFSACKENKQVDNEELTYVFNSEVRSPKSQPIENHFILSTPGREAVSFRCENQLDISVLATEGSTSPSRCVLNSKCTQIPTCPVSQTPLVENQEEPKIGAGALYDRESLSELCLKVESLKAQCLSSSTSPSAAEPVTQKPITHTFNSKAPYPGKRKRRRGFDSSTVTDSSSSADENERDSKPSSDEEPVEHDEPGGLRFNDDVTSHIKDKGITPSQSVKDSTVPNGFLDVSRAYEEDVLILDVIQDDPDLFGAVVAETVNKPGTLAKDDGETKTKCQTGNHCKIVWDLDTDSSSKSAPDLKLENMEDGRLRTVKEMQSYKAQPSQGLQLTSALKSENAVDLNNNQEIKNANVYSIKVMNTRTSMLVMDTNSFGYGYTAKDSCASRTSNHYCWFYFDEHNFCQRSCCRFSHIPRDGDEMFCMERIQKFCFVGNPNTVLRAVEVFMEYYSKCSPGVCFSQEIVNSLLSSLLHLGLLRKFVDIINLLLTHKSLPSPEIVLAAFKHVRDRGLIDSISELILLTSKVVEAGCVFSVEQCEVMQSHLQMMQVPRQQMDIFLAVKCRALATNPHTAELSDLAQAVVRVEMLKHWEDWSGMAHVFCGVCVGPHSTSELHRFYCCVTMALLKEPKDNLTLPYELFAESVCKKVPSDDMVKITLGRIGVSMIFRYHRTREWNKGVKLVNVMFGLQIEFTTLKGLMGDEYKVSRCQLVTSATELFLHSGCIEGALKMLRADNWFVTSNVWPCDPADIDCRKCVLTLLAGRTSHRDTFDILANLPGLRQPINGVQVDEYTEMFNAHLRLCVKKQTLPVAADILEFMFAQGVVPETAQLQNLIHKLGKQNNWNCARTLFNRARSAGYYSAVVCEQDSLFLPCSLTEIEMTLAFEMFITSIKAHLQAPTGSSQPISITLRRQGEVEDVTESMYLAAGCRLLSAALIPNPKLSIRYTAVNQTQEQLFILDRGSAHKWLSQNEQWALEMWVS
ncbi:protein TOPAZ1 [Triplophysa rosa]|uniref:protein TOPAZ1 n=1 Tax=Triplophysa rosa TaxID=992332 RepID=UPI002545DB51|nr:protein TOPAZ1 [Triplophysa rosa]